MNIVKIKIAPAALVLAGLLTAGLAGLEAAPVRNPGQPGGGYVARLERAVGLSPEQRDSVRGLLAQQREKTQAVRAETDAKIRGLLNAEQQKKYDAFQTESRTARRNRGA